MTLQIIRDWVLKFNADGPDGLIDRKAPGQLSLLDDRHRTALVAMVESGPIQAVHGVVRWRVIDLCQWVWDEFSVSVSPQTMSRELRAMGYRKLSARPGRFCLSKHTENGDLGSPARRSALCLRSWPCGGLLPARLVR